MKARELATNKWRSVLTALGISPDSLDGRHHPCPMNGDGKDRFRFADRNGSGSYFCACSAGEKGGMALLMCCKGIDYAGAAKLVESVVGNAEVEKPKPEADPAPRLRALWAASSKCGPMVSDYLRSRMVDAPACLREAVCTYWQGDQKIGKFPAMVALIQSPTGEAASLHVTYLQDGKKAPLDPYRKIMPPAKPIIGGAIRLFPATDVLGVAEGIETALSAAKLFNIPVWATVSAGGMAGFVWPATVKELWIFGDNDTSFTGQHAAYSLARRAKKSGIDVAVCIPPKGDWNDELQAKAS